MRAFWITMLALASIGWAIAQDVPPLPPLRGDAASLKDTMKFIQDKLPGKVNYVVYVHDSVTGTDSMQKWTVLVTDVSADRCSIAFHFQFDNEQHTKNLNEVREVSLKDVREVSLAPLDQATQLVLAKRGNPERSVKIDPPVFFLTVRTSTSRGGTGFSFYDEALADRVVKALQHAVDLCGGGNQEPF
jgi:hypothetical protein